MAKAKAPPGVQNKHIYTRASYLYQAAAYLATASDAASSRIKNANEQAQETSHGPASQNGKPEETRRKKSAQDAQTANARTQDQRTALRSMSRGLLADMRAVSLKVLIRQRPELKRSVCRYCDTLLLAEGTSGGGSCDVVVENASRGGRKPWADVLVVRCRTCGGAKRFPVGEPRTKQLRKGLREKQKLEKGKGDVEEDGANKEEEV